MTVLCRDSSGLFSGSDFVRKDEGGTFAEVLRTVRGGERDWGSWDAELFLMTHGRYVFCDLSQTRPPSGPTLCGRTEGTRCGGRLTP